MKRYDVIVIGGGPAGLASAISAYEQGVNVCLIERENKLGGILKQCIHDGFGLTRFKEKLSGPEYAYRYIEEFKKHNIDTYLTTFVTKIEKENDEFKLTIVSEKGLSYLQGKALVLATGCRERTSKQVNIHGDRVAGIYNAGNAQNFINLLGQRVGNRAVILGSGDIGLIMARRLTLEGCKVLGCYEVMDCPSGLPRNIRQCLNDFDIPLHLSTTITKVYGDQRVEAVEVAKVDEQMRPIEDSKQIIECDCLIVSVGLIPENELAESLGIVIDSKTKGPKCNQNYETSLKGVFACGNCFHVYDLADNVSKSGEEAGLAASKYVLSNLKEASEMIVPPVVKKKLDPNKLICIGCPNSCELDVREDNGELFVKGNRCEKGKNFAIEEMKAPKRSVCSSVKTIYQNTPVLSVRTSKDIDKNLIFEVMKKINEVLLDHPVSVGEIIIENVLNSGVDIIATSELLGEK